MKIRMTNKVMIGLVLCSGVMLLPFILLAKVGYEVNKLQNRLTKMSN